MKKVRYSLVALLSGAVVLTGCSSSDSASTGETQEGAANAQEEAVEEPEAEAQQTEEPEAEAQQTEEPEAEAQQTEAPAKVRVDMTLLIRGNSSVGDGTEVRVTDGSGNLLGFGKLTNSGTSANFSINRSGDGFYQVTVGGINSPLSYSESDIQDGVLEIFAGN